MSKYELRTCLPAVVAPAGNSLDASIGPSRNLRFDRIDATDQTTAHVSVSDRSPADRGRAGAVADLVTYQLPSDRIGATGWNGVCRRGIFRLRGNRHGAVVSASNTSDREGGGFMSFPFTSHSVSV